MVLRRDEYDAGYFDGALQRVAHNAGYACYQRYQRFDGPGSIGEYWRDVARDWCERFSLTGKRVMELGCAKGFVVEDLRALGVDAYGCDISAYAISQASDSIRSYLQCGDVREVLQQHPTNEFDFIFSRGFLECVDPVALPALIIETNRTARRQVHFIHTDTNPNFYVQQSLDEWTSYDWKPNTTLIALEGAVERVI